MEEQDGERGDKGIRGSWEEVDQREVTRMMMKKEYEGVGKGRMEEERGGEKGK